MANQGTHAGVERRDETSRRQIVEELLRSLRDIRFGSVEIVIHDSRVVRIERRERVRLGGDDSPAGR